MSTKRVTFNIDEHDLARKEVEFAKIPEPTKQIDSIQFSLLRGQDIHRGATVSVSEYKLHRDDRVTPYASGPKDLRMGTSESSRICETCKGTLFDCPGHFGFIKLALPVFHVGYFKHTLSVLQAVCKDCSKLLLSEDERQRSLKRIKNNAEPSQNLKVLKAMLDECKKMRTCLHCGAHNGTVKKKPSESLKIIHDRYNVTKDHEVDDLIKKFEHSCNVNPEVEKSLKDAYEELDPLKTAQIFSKIDEDDIQLFHMEAGLCKPSDLLVTHVPTPPVCIRPTVVVDAGTTNEDDLTMQLSEMVYCNQEIQNCIRQGQSTKQLLEMWNRLQWTVALYLNAETPGIPLDMLKKKPSRGLSQRVKGKHGRFRQHLSGKRVDFTGRTVISPDPNCAIDEVMVPVLMAKTLTFPDKVNRYNIEKLRKLILSGPEVHPGANFVEVLQENGSMNKISLHHARNRVKIADELKIGDTVERHLADGDAVLFNRQPSLHRVSIMSHKARIMPHKTLRFNECVCAPYNADFDGDEMNIHVPQTEEARAEARTLMNVKNNICVPKAGEPLIAATQDFLTASFLLTQKDQFFNRSQLMQYCGYFCDANERIELPPPAIVKPVELWTGKQLVSVMLRPNRHSNVIVNCELRERNYNAKDQKEQMDRNDGYVIIKNSEHLCGNLAKKTMGGGSKEGLFYSLIRDNTVEVAAACMLRLSKFSARWISNLGYSIGIGDVTPFTALTSTKKELLQTSYAKCDSMIEKFNNGELELKAGCNADQSLEDGLNGELGNIREKAGDLLKRSLPKHNAALIMAVCGSKGSNINLSQMIACVGQQTVNGRRMPNGFLNRSLPHFEPYSKYAEAKGFVKNSFYTGLTASEFFFHTMGGREGLVDTAVKTAETGYMQRRLVKSMEDLIVCYDKTVRSGDESIIQFKYGGDGLDPLYMDENEMPVSLGRLYVIIKEATKKAELDKPMLTPSQIRDSTARAIDQRPNKHASPQFCDKLSKFLNELASKIDRILFNVSENGHDSSAISFLHNFDYLTRSQFDKFIDLVWRTYERAEIQPGEACGAVAAQSIGEPTTQMTLKTFHFAGVASMNVTLGVPRIKEIINATEKISTPIIRARLENESSQIAARIVKGRIEKTELGDVAEYIKEVYSPSGCYLSIKIDLAAIDALQLEVTVETIRQSILKTSKLKVKDKHIRVVRHDKMHIEPYETSRDKLYFVMQQLKAKLPHVIIKGMPGIQRAVISKKEGAEDCFNLAIEGYGLAQVMRTPGIDFRATSTNHIMETAQVLGIEAARRCIIEEIKFTIGQYGIQVDDRHIQLLADEMTFKGQVLGITRFGVQKMKKSVLMLASFEMTTDHLYNSAIQCKKDEIQGVTECIVMGTQVPIGTGMFKVCYDDKVKPESQKAAAVEELIAGRATKRARAKEGQDYLKPSDDLLFDTIN